LPEQYEVKISKAQKAAAESGIRLWSVVPKFTFNVWALSQQVRSAIESALVAAQEEMITDGALAGADDKMTVFYAGHSRGGVSMQEVFGGLFKNNALLSNSFRVQRNAAASDDKESPILKHNVAGLMFFGVSLSRKYRNSTDNFVADLPSLTVGAELDGLYRITRVAETFWYYLNGATDEESILRHPVFVMRGGSHRSFVHGKSSFFVNLNDLEPEITEEASSDYLSSVISNFIVYQVSDRSSSESLRAKSDLLAEHEQSKGYYQPIVDALLLEGSYNLKPACSDVPAGTNCWKGCEWTEHIQKHVSSLSVSPIVEDSFFKVWKIPFHLPKFNAKCEKNDPNCVVRSETVTELKYGLLNGLDTGFDLTASSEMKVKLSSRQAMLEASGEKNVNFTATDDYDTFCAELNQVAFDYALKIADSAALKRYFTKGAMLTFGKDLGPYVGKFC
jgi:hypothetical protein